MDKETEDFISGEFTKVHERLDTHGEMLSRDDTLETHVNDLEAKIDNLAAIMEMGFSHIGRLASYAAAIHDDVKVLLRAHPSL